MQLTRTKRPLLPKTNPFFLSGPERWDTYRSALSGEADQKVTQLKDMQVIEERLSLELLGNTGGRLTEHLPFPPQTAGHHGLKEEVSCGSREDWKNLVCSRMSLQASGQVEEEINQKMRREGFWRFDFFRYIHFCITKDKAVWFWIPWLFHPSWISKWQGFLSGAVCFLPCTEYA